MPRLSRRRHATLTREDERRLFLALKRPEYRDEALRLLTKHNIRLIGFTIGKYFSYVRNVDEDDLFGAGTLGLLEAFEGFDPDRGTKFSTYAIWQIRSAIGRYVEGHARVVRVPSWLLNDWRKTEQGGKRSGRFSFISLDEPLVDEDGREDTKTRVDLLVDSRPDTEARAVEKELQDRVRAAIATLPEREQTIMRMRHGIGYVQEYTHEEIARVVDLSRERVRQLDVIASKKLAKKLKGVA